MTKAELEWGVEQMRLLLQVKRKDEAQLQALLALAAGALEIIRDKIHQVAGAKKIATIALESIEKYHEEMMNQRYRDLQIDTDAR